MPLKAFDPADEPEINMTPMIDCVFLLLIFFMIGTQFIDRENQFDIKLPTASVVAPLTKAPDEIVINVQADGTVSVLQQKYSLTELEEMLKAAKANYSDQAVIVRGSGPDPYQLVVDVLDVCEKVQISQVSLASRVRETK